MLQIGHNSRTVFPVTNALVKTTKIRFIKENSIMANTNNAMVKIFESEQF